MPGDARFFFWFRVFVLNVPQREWLAFQTEESRSEEKYLHNV